ncbi:MAG: DUF1015 family protein [Peptostreptococcales bacterium]
MAVVRPFKAIRPRKDLADKVISLPYDVMNRHEAKAMAESNPYSFLRICRSEIDLPDEFDPYCKAVYEKAKINIDTFLDQGILFQDDTPSFYIYQQIMDGRSQTGIVACTSIDDYQNNVIKKHEFTREEKEMDRINHFDVCDANTEPIFLTYRNNEAIESTLSLWMDSHEPEYEIITSDGISHILWVLNDKETIQTLSDTFSSIDALYIADGHHRSASSFKVGMKRRKENPGYTGEEEFNFFLSVIFPDKDLKIFDYNRVVKDLHGLTTEAFLEAVAENFEIEKIPESNPYRPGAPHTFGMFLDKEWYKLTAKDAIIDETDPIKKLDVSILQDYLLDPILGIKDPRRDKRIDFIGGIRGLRELEKRATSDMRVAFSLYPVDIASLLAVSDNDKIMPPKSTWFEPKLGSGLFMHCLK